MRHALKLNQLWIYTIELFDKKNVLSNDKSICGNNTGEQITCLSNKHTFLLINLRDHKDQWEIKVTKEMRVREVRKVIVASLDSMGFLEVQYV